LQLSIVPLRGLNDGDLRLKTRDTAIVLTPPGAAAIAVIRISGPGVEGFLSKHFSRTAAPLRCVHGALKDSGGAVIDDPVVVLSSDGNFADINLHGGPWVIASTMELLRRSGFDIVEEGGAGEPLPAEAVEGETILDREVMSHLPLAKTEQGVRMLLAQPENWRRFIANNPSPDAIQRILDDDCLTKMLRPPHVAIVGAPNVGKSTLANQLFAQQRSITADIPGTTRDWVGEIANIDGLPVMLVDTPGVRETTDSIEHRAIERSREIVSGADLVLYVIDATAPVPPAASMAAALRVLNKADRADPPELEYDLATIATSGQGVDELRRLIREKLGCADLALDAPRCWTSRQRTILERAVRDPREISTIEN
jgi:tRNA modification GTPase